ncbi:MAG TPA: hypothetical protein VF209_01215 [Patescibacteria group bacterium]
MVSHEHTFPDSSYRSLVYLDGSEYDAMILETLTHLYDITHFTNKAEFERAAQEGEYALIVTTEVTEKGKIKLISTSRRGDTQEIEWLIPLETEEE